MILASAVLSQYTNIIANKQTNVCIMTTTKLLEWLSAIVGQKLTLYLMSLHLIKAYTMIFDMHAPLHKRRQKEHKNK